MAWIYLAESAEYQSHSNHGCEQSLTVNKTDTLSQYYFQDKLKESCTELQSGMTCKRSLETCCRQLTLSLEDSHARISALRAMVRVWQESEAGFIGNCFASSKKRNHNLYFSKTSQQLGRPDLIEWSHHLPQSGMTVGGRLYQPEKLAPLTPGKGGSFWLPTPTAKHYGSNKGGAKGRVGLSRHSIHQLSTLGLLPGHPKGVLNRTYLELAMGYPIMWTEIGALGIAWYQRKQEKRLKSLQDLNEMEFPA